MNMLIDNYEESTVYEWKKSKAKLWEVDAQKTFSDFLSAEYYEKGAYLYAIDEKQLYRASHTKKLRYLGKVEVA